MKLHARTATAISLIAALAGSLLFASCQASPIFAAIEKEVALEKPSITGYVTSMVIQSDGTKFVTNGRVYQKAGADGSWSELDLPAHRCLDLAYDGTYVYGLMTQDDWVTPAGIYRYMGNSWVKVFGTDSMTRVFSGYNRVFAFTRTGDVATGTYNAFSISNQVTPTITQLATDLALPTGSAVSGTASWFSTAAGIYGQTGTALGLGSITDDILALTASPGGILYAVTKSSLYQTTDNGGTWTQADHNGIIGGSASLAWLPKGATDGVVLIGGAKRDGYSEISVSDLTGTPTMSAVHDPGEGVSSVLADDKTQYQSAVGNKTLTSIFVDTVAGSVGGNEYVVYAGVANDRGYDGLWAYYPDTRSEWNRE